MNREEKEARRISRRAANTNNKQTKNATEAGSFKSAEEKSKNRLFHVEHHEALPLLFESVGMVVFGYLATLFADHKGLTLAFGLGSAACALAAGATKLATRFGPKRVWRLYVLLVILLACGVVITHAKSSRDLSASCNTVIQTDDPNLFRMLINIGNEQLVTPCPTILFLQLTSHRREPFMINSYQVEFSAIGADKWYPVGSLDTGRLLMVHDPKAAQVVDKSGRSFNTEIANKNVMPGETVQGWLHLDTIVEGRPRDVRIHIWDTVGKKSTAKVQFRGPRLDAETAVQRGSLLAGERIDIASMRLLPYQGRHGP